MSRSGNEFSVFIILPTVCFCVAGLPLAKDLRHAWRFASTAKTIIYRAKKLPM